jgi:hypothetical protein
MHGFPVLKYRLYQERIYVRIVVRTRHVFAYLCTDVLFPDTFETHDTIRYVVADTRLYRGSTYRRRINSVSNKISSNRLVTDAPSCVTDVRIHSTVIRVWYVFDTSSRISTLWGCSDTLWYVTIYLQHEIQLGTRRDTSVMVCAGTLLIQ